MGKEYKRSVLGVTLRGTQPGDIPRVLEELYHMIESSSYSHQTKVNHRKEMKEVLINFFHWDPKDVNKAFSQMRADPSKAQDKHKERVDNIEQEAVDELEEDLEGMDIASDPQEADIASDPLGGSEADEEGDLLTEVEEQFTASFNELCKQASGKSAKKIREIFHEMASSALSFIFIQALDPEVVEEILRQVE